ncbi:hypothetical protein BCR32DRAFT_109721 [Anaeromyces robustus]|uniref:Uncharacterized protein n=1 Tax=Anaeromyces robustus TaxID=1754192 RepID=A0A1Y1W1M0_9FUNG|nr:hypothetical protein BCR32DRAFT_109721 [Anaeromyces robustus]|eukprot:ORX67004.1 hypothetical protein BCR32DRAFT_109721 [Anaeromyces robustus]
MEVPRDTSTNAVEETTQEKQSFGFFNFFKSKKTESDNKGKNEETNNTEINTEENKTTEIKTENVTIDIEPQSEKITDIPSSSNNNNYNHVIINEINLYDDEPTVRDIPFDIYDDSIKLEPQNPINKNYQSINNDDNNLNNINLYEATPETKKTFFQKLNEIYKETIRLIKAFIKGIFSFLWAITGGTITAIFVFFRNLYFNILCSCIKFIFRANKKSKKERVIDNIEDIRDNIWDVNRALITKPLYQNEE